MSSKAKIVRLDTQFFLQLLLKNIPNVILFTCIMLPIIVYKLSVYLQVYYFSSPLAVPLGWICANATVGYTYDIGLETHQLNI
jgi:hypothetical protein